MKTNTNQMQIMTLLGVCVSRTLVYCNAFEWAAAGVILHCNVHMKRDRDSRPGLKEIQTTIPLKWVLPSWELKNEKSGVGGEDDNFYEWMPGQCGSC